MGRRQRAHRDLYDPSRVRHMQRRDRGTVSVGVRRACPGSCARGVRSLRRLHGSGGVGRCACVLGRLQPVCESDRRNGAAACNLAGDSTMTIERAAGALLFTMLMASPAGAQEESHWGVAGTFVPRWEFLQALEDVMERDIEMTGTDVRVGVIRGRQHGGDWGV